MNGQGTEFKDSSQLYFQLSDYLRPGISLPQAAADFEFWTGSFQPERMHHGSNSKLSALHCQVSWSVILSLFCWIGHCSGVNLIIFEMVEIKEVYIITVSLAAWFFFSPNLYALRAMWSLALVSKDLAYEWFGDLLWEVTEETKVSPIIAAVNSIFCYNHILCISSLGHCINFCYWIKKFLSSDTFNNVRDVKVTWNICNFPDQYYPRTKGEWKRERA